MYPPIGYINIKMFIYKTTNLINGKIYIGQSIFTPEQRPNYLGSGVKIKKDIKEIGKNNFIREIIENNIDNEDLLNSREIYWISFFESSNPTIGYNVLKGGRYVNVKEAIKEACNRKSELKRKSDSSKILWESSEYRKKVTDSNIIAWSNIDLKNKHSSLMKQKFSNNEYKDKLKKSLSLMEILECPHCNKKMKKNHAMSKHFDNCIKHSDPIKRLIALERYKSINDSVKKVICPYCNKSGLVGNMNRWHFDNCKHK